MLLRRGRRVLAYRRLLERAAKQRIGKLSESQNLHIWDGSFALYKLNIQVEMLIKKLCDEAWRTKNVIDSFNAVNVDIERVVPFLEPYIPDIRSRLRPKFSWFKARDTAQEKPRHEEPKAKARAETTARPPPPKQPADKPDAVHPDANRFIEDGAHLLRLLLEQGVGLPTGETHQAAMMLVATELAKAPREPRFDDAATLLAALEKNGFKVQSAKRTRITKIVGVVMNNVAVAQKR